jgi:hypothetical protein
MASKQVGMGLLSKMLIGVLVPVLLGFFIIGSMIFSVGVLAPWK